MNEDDVNKQMQNLGNRLRELRKEKGYSNYELFAYENGISRSQYGKYEKGSDIRFTTLIKVVDALGLSLKDFFAEGFEEFHDKEQEK